MKNKCILVLGIGSPFGDDQLGWKVVDQLLQRPHPNVEVQKVDRPGLNLLFYLEQKQYDQVVLVDAVNANVPPGTCFKMSAEEIVLFEGFLSSHNVGVAPALALASVLQYPIDHVHFYGVQAERLFVKDDGMSDVMQGVIPTVCQEIEDHFFH